jgi:YggT family protein
VTTVLVYLVLGTRGLVFLCFLLASIVALAHWAVKHGYLQPFSGLATGVRRLAEPVLKPVERRVHARGGNPVNAPYYLFWGTLFGGLAIVALVQWLVGTIYELTVASAAGSRGLLLMVVGWIFSILMLAIFIRVISSWFSLSPYSKFMRIVNGLTDWLIEPLRKVIPPIGMIDIVPMVAYFMLYLARNFLLGALSPY